MKEQITFLSIYLKSKRINNGDQVYQVPELLEACLLEEENF